MIPGTRLFSAHKISEDTLAEVDPKEDEMLAFGPDQDPDPDPDQGAQAGWLVKSKDESSHKWICELILHYP